MSVDLIENHSPALDIDHPVEAMPDRDASPPVDAEPLPQVVVIDGPADPIEALLLSVAHGDQEALVALQSRMAGLVRVNVRRILRDASQANAVTESVFAELLENAIRFDPDRSDAQTWLLTRAHQHAMDGLHHVDDASHPADPELAQPTPALPV